MADNTADLLDHLTAEARRVYVEQRQAFEYRRTGLQSHYGDKPLPRWDGTADDDRPCVRAERRRDRLGRNYKPVWPEIARFAVLHGADVGGLIRARFSVATGRNAPEPPECKTDLALQAYEQRQERIGPQLASLLESQRLTASTELFLRSRYIETMGWTPAQVIGSVAGDPTTGLVPLFRAIFAAENGHAELFRSLLPDAVQQYYSARAHFDASPWSKLIPPEVRAGADRLTEYARRPGR